MTEKDANSFIIMKISKIAITPKIETGKLTSPALVERCSRSHVVGWLMVVNLCDNYFSFFVFRNERFWTFRISFELWTIQEFMLSQTIRQFVVDYLGLIFVKISVFKGTTWMKFDVDLIRHEYQLESISVALLEHQYRVNFYSVHSMKQ